MKLYIKQRVFSIGDKFDIYDESQNVAYTVKSAIFSLGHQRTLYDARENEVGFVKQKLLHLMPTFEIYNRSGLLGTVSKKWTFFSNNYSVDFRGWDIEGNIMGWDYSVTSSSGTVATITKKLFSFGDSYEINVRDDEDVEEIIMLVLAIDAVNENKNGGVSVSVSD